MIYATKRTLLIICSIFIATLIPNTTMAKDKFVLVIDAGHGGHDAGASGRISKEKNINLAIALLLGKQIEQKYKDVKVIYTRKTDVFIKLEKRSEIANKNRADLFMSIHTNSTKNKRVYGTETYVLGLHKTQSNLDVAMRENAVIMLEDNYQTHYQNFNPNSVDSYIMFNFMQDKYLDNSLSLAIAIENEFKKNKRYSRGVRQAGFLVLYNSACPSILVELGFISNRAEERYLTSKAGQTKMANAICKAFDKYKNKYDSKEKQAKAKSLPLEKNKKTQNTKNKLHKTTAKNDTKTQEKKDKITYKIQLFAVKKKIKQNHSSFKGLKNTSYIKEGNFYKYLYEEKTSYKEIEKARRKIAKKFPKAFVVAFRNQQKISTIEARKRQKNN